MTALTGRWYAQALKRQLNGNAVDWDGDTIKVALLGPGYTPNQDTHDFFNDLSDEVVGAGYTAGGQAVTTRTVGYDSTQHETQLLSDNITWLELTATIRYAITYKSTGNAATSPLLNYFDFGTTYVSTAKNLTLSFDSRGLLHLRTGRTGPTGLVRYFPNSFSVVPFPDDVPLDPQSAVMAKDMERLAYNVSLAVEERVPASAPVGGLSTPIPKIPSSEGGLSYPASAVGKSMTAANFDPAYPGTINGDYDTPAPTGFSCKRVRANQNWDSWTYDEKRYCNPVLSYQATIGTTQYSTPIYRVNNSTPRVQVFPYPNPLNPDGTVRKHKFINSDQAGAVALRRIWESVPIPVGAQPAPGLEGQLNVYDEDNDILYEFFQLANAQYPLSISPGTPTDGNWYAIYGGIIYGTETSPGHYVDIPADQDATTDPATIFGQFGWGGPACSIPALACYITIEQLLACEAGTDEIGHCVFIATGRGYPGAHVYPAQRSDAVRLKGNGPMASDATFPKGYDGKIPRGTRLRLDPTKDYYSPGSPDYRTRPFMRWICKAVQDYGMIDCDHTGSGMVLFTEGWRAGATPDLCSRGVTPGQASRLNAKPGGLFYDPTAGASQSFSNIMVTEFPWEDLQVPFLPPIKTNQSAQTPAPSWWPSYTP